MNISISAPASPAGWQHSINQVVALRPSHVIRFSIVGVGWGVCVNQEGSTHWLVGLDATGKATVEKYNGSTYSQVASRTIAYGATTPTDVLVQFSEIRYGGSNDLWRTTALWLNGIHAINYVEAQTSAVNTPLKFGLAVRAGTSLTFTNIQVPALGEMAEVATLDTDETPASGLQRTIEGRYLKYVVRSNGKLHAWRPKPVPQVYSLPDWDSSGEEHHDNQIRTHIRMVGAYDFAEYANDALIDTYGYSFREVKNPYLMSEEDCYQEAKNEVRRLRENAIGGDVTNDALHFLEIEDGLLVDGKKRLINSMTLNYRGPSVVHQFNLRGDFWDA